jgi:hypothetical protein
MISASSRCMRLIVASFTLTTFPFRSLPGKPISYEAGAQTGSRLSFQTRRSARDGLTRGRYGILALPAGRRSRLHRSGHSLHAGPVWRTPDRQALSSQSRGSGYRLPRSERAWWRIVGTRSQACSLSG